MTKFNIACYVKLAKLWQKRKDKIPDYYMNLFGKKFSSYANFKLTDVYIDITGENKTYKRPEMIRLLFDIKRQEVNCIYTQTQAYLAANSQEFFYLIKYLYEINENLNIVTDDEEYNINTFINDDFQKEELLNLSNYYVKLKQNDYIIWKNKVEENFSGIAKI